MSGFKYFKTGVYKEWCDKQKATTMSDSSVDGNALLIEIRAKWPEFSGETSCIENINSDIWKNMNT